MTLEFAHLCAPDGSTSSIPSENSVLFQGDLVLACARHDMVRNLAKYMKS